jgi:toxoflavin synthase
LASEGNHLTGRLKAVLATEASRWSGVRLPFGSLSQIWVETRVAGVCCEGAPITSTFHLEDGPFDDENYFLDVETHQEALRAAGFRDIRWHRPLLPEGEAAHGRGYWSDLLDYLPVIFIECFK